MEESRTIPVIPVARVFRQPRFGASLKTGMERYGLQSSVDLRGCRAIVGKEFTWIGTILRNQLQLSLSIIGARFGSPAEMSSCFCRRAKRSFMTAVSTSIFWWTHLLNCRMERCGFLMILMTLFSRCNCRQNPESFKVRAQELHQASFRSIATERFGWLAS